MLLLRISVISSSPGDSDRFLCVFRLRGTADREWRLHSGVSHVSRAVSRSFRYQQQPQCDGNSAPSSLCAVRMREWIETFFLGELVCPSVFFSFLFFSFFLFFVLVSGSMRKFLGQRGNPRQSTDSTGSLTSRPPEDSNSAPLPFCLSVCVSF